MKKYLRYLYAGVVELVDAWDLKSLALIGVRVRLPSPVPKIYIKEVIIMKHFD